LPSDDIPILLHKIALPKNLVISQTMQTNNNFWTVHLVQPFMVTSTEPDKRMLEQLHF